MTLLEQNRIVTPYQVKHPSRTAEQWWWFPCFLSSGRELCSDLLCVDQNCDILRSFSGPGGIWLSAPNIHVSYTARISQDLEHIWWSQLLYLAEWTELSLRRPEKIVQYFLSTRPLDLWWSRNKFIFSTAFKWNKEFHTQFVLYSRSRQKIKAWFSAHPAPTLLTSAPSLLIPQLSWPTCFSDLMFSTAVFNEDKRTSLKRPICHKRRMECKHREILLFFARYVALFYFLIPLDFDFKSTTPTCSTVLDICRYSEQTSQWRSQLIDLLFAKVIQLNWHAILHLGLVCNKLNLCVYVCVWC